MKRKIFNFLSKFLIFCKSYVELCLWLLVFAVGIRFFEAVMLSRVNYHFGLSLVWNLAGLCYDISLFFRVSVWFLIAFTAFCFLHEKTARITLRVILSVMLWASLILILFFVTSGFLLDKVLFTYSFTEIWGIVSASAKTPVWVYAIIVGLPLLYFYLSGKRIKINRVLWIIFTTLMLSSFFIFNNLSPNTDQYHVKVNKEHFFLQSLLKKQIPAFKENDKDIIKAVEEFRSHFPKLKFKETEYPFLYQAVYKDVLSPFFNLKPEPPNLVFIIVEGLCYDYVNNGQCMPFLDSLSAKSLSWEYCLSASSRTFGVLPALFGAAPLGDKGFMDQSPNNPEFQSLPRILSQNRYTNNLFYGGWIGFDNMESFAKTNDITYFKNIDWEHDIKNETIDSEWGYEDHLTYMQALRKLNHIKSSPRMDLYLSLTTHAPFEHPNSMHFQNIMKDRVTQSKILSDKQKERYLKEINIYGCFAYADWSIEQLIEGYKNRDDFDNTIFIITGDHPHYTTQFAGYSNYHVPLMIYSPMLKTGRKMKGVVSHRDITPTLLSLLKNNYNIETPKEVTWLNTALDTSLSFNAHTFSPLQIMDHSIGGILYNNYILCEGILEELTDGAPRKVNDPAVLQKMNRLLSLYQYFDSYILNNDALVRNYLAHKFKAANIMINIEDTIAAKSYYAKKSKLQVVEGPQGRKTTLYFDSTNRYPLEFIKFPIPDSMESFRVEIEFMIYIINKTNDNEFLNVVMDLRGVSYKSDFLAIDHQNRWYTYKNAITYKKEMLEQLGEERDFSLYLWNNRNLEGYIDNIKVKVIANK